VTAPLEGQAGYDALTTAAGAVRLDRDIVRVGGPEAVDFLQGQMTQDISALAVGASSWSLVLQPQGKVDAWVRVTRAADDEVLLDLDGGFGDALVARLQRFKLRVKADIDRLAWECVAVRGPGAVPPGIPFAWGCLTGFDVLGPDPALPDGVPEVAAAVYEVCRIEAGLPRMGAELTDKTIPAEVGLVGVSVSFTKGCYTGQELVARIDSRGGHVPRHLRRLVLESGDVPDAGASIETDGRVVGTVTSAARHPAGHIVGLGLLGRDVTPPTTAMCGGVVVIIDALAAMPSA